MKGLSKAQRKRKDDVEQRLAHEGGNVQSAHADYQAAIAKYNEVVEEANEWREEVEGDTQSYIEDRSERWQEGERGEATVAFVDEYANEVETLEDPDEPDLTENLDAYPDEVEL